ncbi:hypothetical protein ACROYT_G041630 [Oculina patagonica]
MILGPTLRALVDVFDWRNTFLVFAGILTVTSVNGFFLHQRAPSSDEHERASPKKFRLNFSLLKNPTIIILVITAGVYTFSRMVPYVHLIKHCDDLGIPDDKSSTLYLFIGIFASLGRLGAGFLCNMKCTNSLRLFQAAVFVMGASTMLLTLAKTYAKLVVYAIIFSMADGMMITTFIIICMHMETLEESKRASVVGFNIFFRDICFEQSVVISTRTQHKFDPGFMADKFGNYTAAFLMAGGAGVIASIIPFLLICVKQESKQNVDNNLVGEAIDKGPSKNVNGKDEKQSGEDELCPNSEMITTCITHQKPASFVLAVE